MSVLKFFLGGLMGDLFSLEACLMLLWSWLKSLLLMSLCLKILYFIQE